MKKMRTVVRAAGVLQAMIWMTGTGVWLPGPAHAAAARPNILWVSAEDISPNLGCYGDAYASTPALDAFAKRGTVYRHCWSNAGSCAPARTALITGVYPTSAGAEHMRSLVPMSPRIRMFPQILREAGYYCSNNSKTDYNLAAAGDVWDESSPRAHWRNRPAGAPFFSVFNLTKSHESQIQTPLGSGAPDPAAAPLPPFHPDTPEVRRDWARYYENIATMDGQFADLLAHLEADGLADDTIVFFFGDHGSGMPGFKHTARNSGLHAPLIIHVPEPLRAIAGASFEPGARIDRLVSFVDFAPTVLSLTGLQPPEWMQGRAFLGPHETPPREYVHGFRGRAGSRVDMVRSVRDQRHIYIRNYLPHIPAGRPNYYAGTPLSARIWRELFHQGNLTPEQSAYWRPRPPEELYDLLNDPHEIRNLAGSPEHQTVLTRLRAAHRDHVRATLDAGFLPEAGMNARVGDDAPYDFVRDPERCPLDRIVAMAEAASGGGSDAARMCRDGLADTDAAVRYWAATGLLLGGRDIVAEAAAGLRHAMEDASPDVRIAAAHALARHGGNPDRDAALKTLIEALSYEKHGVYVCTAALNAVDLLGEVALPCLDAVRAIPDRVRPTDGRPGQALGWTKNGIAKQLQAAQGDSAGDGTARESTRTK